MFALLPAILYAQAPATVKVAAIQWWSTMGEQAGEFAHADLVP